MCLEEYYLKYNGLEKLNVSVTSCIKILPGTNRMT